MSALIDFEKIAKVFNRRNEKVVVVVPGMEPVVLVPLAQYDELTNKPSSLKAGESVAKTAVKPNNQVKHQPQLPPKPVAPVEPIDPLQGGLEDDDQYFPEPL